jgi:hypothetical protein
MQKTYNDYLLGQLRAKLTGEGHVDAEPLAEWEWELLHGTPVQVVLVALFNDGSSESVYNVVPDSWKMEGDFLAVEANDGDEIHYLPNVRRFYTVCQ